MRLKLVSIALPLLLSALCLAQTEPLFVCKILSRAADWDNNIVLVRAHYVSFWDSSSAILEDDDTHCSIELVKPEVAAQEDAEEKRKYASRRTPVTLKVDSKLADLYRYGSVRDDKNPDCPMLDVVATVWGRVDSKPIQPAKKHCSKPFGCKYEPRLVLESVEEVSIGHSKPPCKVVIDF